MELIFKVPTKWQVILSFKYWLSQMTSEGSSGFDLLKQIILVNVFIGILWCVIVWIKIFINTLVLLDLNCGSNSLLTEGSFVASSTTGDNLWFQI